MPPEEVSKIMLRAQNLTKTNITLTPGPRDTGTAVTANNTVAENKVATGGGGKGDFINGLPVFGTDFFDNPNISMAPDANRPTPSNYILGPGDALNINIYGNSVVSWNLSVSPEGFIVLPGMGKVYVGGKAMAHAIEMIKQALVANNYAIGHGTSMDVSLSNIRSIQVSINGYVKHPGNYMLSSLSTVFNALYQCGGPGPDGSIRAIKLIRNGRLYARVDVYDFLLKGDKSGDIQLQDGDVIQVPVYNSRVSIEGEVKRPAYYEMMPGESLKDLLYFAGGFTAQAYTKEIKTVRYTGTQKRIEDIAQNQFDFFTPVNGDAYTVDKALDRFENRIAIDGAVFRPGDFELKAGMTLTDLIKNAGGLKEDAYQERGYITRLNPDNTAQIVPFDVKSQADGSGEGIVLQREDIVTIPSIFDLRDNYNVSIRGMVRQPGMFPYAEHMTVKDLILKAGGFAHGANTNRIVIARRVQNTNPDSFQEQQVKVIRIDVDSDFSLGSGNFSLLPYDVVSVFSLPGYRQQGSVELKGEVMYPGTYAILSKTERISDLIKRAGGLTRFAYPEGASLQRESTKEEIERGRLNQKLMLRNQHTLTDDTSSRVDSLTLGVNGVSSVYNSYVGIKLAKILEEPGSKTDLILQDGDAINIPGLKQTVKVSGSVLSPNAVVYNSGRLKYYINRSGGFTENALKRKSFVIYANGSQKGTRGFLFFRSYPHVEPGAEIFVPEKAPKEPMSTQGWISLSTSMASLAALVLAIVRYSK
ncbi:MAG TPA: SLBB domain-containing protein [Edaphocola sp.]|nr:SLBB domain-containing protein [Edaphocola sp.]